MNIVVQRIIRRWNWIRVIYLIMGISVVIQSIMVQEWVAILPGAWFALMGLLGFGCASGNCYVINNSSTNPNPNSIELTDKLNPENKLKE